MSTFYDAAEFDYAPEQDIAERAVDFLRRNPDEQLDAEVVSIKFGCDRHKVPAMLAPAVLAGLLTHAEDLRTGEIVYSLNANQTTEPT